MQDCTTVHLSEDEISHILQWMYRAGASGPVASHLITKLQNAKKQFITEDDE